MPTTHSDNAQMDWDRGRHGQMAAYAEDPDHELTPDGLDDERGV